MPSIENVTKLHIQSLGELGGIEVQGDMLEHWKGEVGRIIEHGFNDQDIYLMRDLLKVQEVKSENLPNGETVLGKASERKAKMFEVSQKLWGLTAEQLLSFEDEQQKKMRVVSGSTETGGKDNDEDVISSEILTRVVATCKLFSEFSGDSEDDKLIRKESLMALNSVVMDACLKGKAREVKIEDPVSGEKRTLYAIMRSRGVMVGAGGSKFLPLPSESLPMLLATVDAKSIKPIVYQEKK